MAKKIREKPNYIRARFVCNKIANEFPTDIPEGLLAFAVVERAIMDLVSRKYRLDALEYLDQPEIPEASICGVNSEWIRQQLTLVELYSTSGD